MNKKKQENSNKSLNHIFSDMREMFTNEMARVLAVSETHKELINRLKTLETTLFKMLKQLDKAITAIQNINTEANILIQKERELEEETRKNMAFKEKKKVENKIKEKKETEKKVKTKQLICSVHKTYSGKRKPKKTAQYPKGCPTCWDIYNERHNLKN